jgi:ABC-2 type transport system permease protein
VRQRLRQLAVCYWLQLKILLVSPFEGFLGLVFPLMFATATLLVYRVRGDADALTYAGLGAAVMGVWTSVTVAASTLLNRERQAGTLELLIAAPTPFSMVLIPVTTAMATVGLVSVALTLAWNRLVFDVRLQIQSWPLFALGVLAATATIAMFGFLLSVVAVRYRTAWALGASLEYPGWLLCGFVVPLSLLPLAVRPISYALAPTWAVAAMRSAASGGSPWHELGICLALGLGYAALAGYLGGRLLDSARRNATLALT